MNDIARNHLEHNMYCTLATVSEEGQPWASPLFFGFDLENLYIRSGKDAQHMVNLRQNQKCFVTVFDSQQKIGEADGLYLQCEATELADIGEVKKALDVMNSRIGTQTDATKFVGEGPRKVVRLHITQAWTNKSHMTDAGYMDYRDEVPLV